MCQPHNTETSREAETAFVAGECEALCKLMERTPYLAENLRCSPKYPKC